MSITSGTLTLTVWSYGLACIGYLGFGLYLLHLVRAGHERWTAAVSTLLATVLLCAAWAGFELAFAYARTPVFLHAGTVTDLLRYGGWYALLLVLIRPWQGMSSAESAGGVWLALVAVGLVGGGLVVHGVAMPAATPLSDPPRAELFHGLSMAIFALVLLEQLFRNVSPDSRWNIKPLCLGLLGVFTFDLYLYSDALLFGRLDVDASSVRGFVHASIIPLLTLSAMRRRDWLARVRLSQKAAFHSATFLIVGVYLLFMASVGYYVRYFGGEWGRGLQMALLFAALLLLGLLVFSGAMRAKLRVLVGKHFFSYRYDYREEWLRFTRTLAAQDSPQAMGEQVIRGLADMVESPSGGLWRRDSSGRYFSQFARWNMAEVEGKVDADSALCEFLGKRGWMINLEELRTSPWRYEALSIPSWLSQVPDAWLLVPLMVGNRMIGFVLLASARTTMDVNWEVTDLLKTAGRQAASFLAQMQATEDLLEARKFEAFNRMSAFVVHDLKNIVTQLSLMVRNAERHRDNPEFQKDMVMTVEHSVERMRQLMAQLRDGLTPSGAVCAVELADIVRRLQAARAGQGRSIEVTIRDSYRVRGHQERMERVIGHLVQNAIEATDERGRVWVKVERRGQQAMLEVGDTGHGMSREFLRERFFKPFQTTKTSGMGIGAYESYQYVRELGGEILVDSEVGVGTRITMLLPLFAVDEEPELHKQEAA